MINNYKETLTRIQKASTANETQKAIRKNWNQFEIWCEKNKLKIFPPNVQLLEKYLLYLMEEKKKISTIEQVKWSIEVVYKEKGYNQLLNSDSIKTIVKGLRRILGTKKKKKRAFTIDNIAKINFPNTLIGLRDKAMLLIGFCGALRRSELANLDCEDLEWEDFGIRLHLKKSKSNQESKEEFVNIMKSKKQNICPVKGIQDWLTTAKKFSGPLFCSIGKGSKIGHRISSTTIGKKVKWAATECGFDNAEFSGHSLRAGCATYLLDKNIPLNIVSKHLRHKKLDTTLQYDRNTTVKTLRDIY